MKGCSKNPLKSRVTDELVKKMSKSWKWLLINHGNAFELEFL